MGQINVNPSSDSGDRSGAATITMVTVVIVLAVLLVVGWWLFTAGPFTMAPRDTTITINPPKVEQPAPSVEKPKP